MVEEFASRFAGRIAGLVVHDKSAMETRVADLLSALKGVGSRLGGTPDGPLLFLEYAAGLEPEWFVAVGEQLADVGNVSLCIDIGHVGVRQARRQFAREHPDLDLASLTPDDERLPELVEDVQRAAASGLPTALEMTRSLGAIGKPLHFHLHDGHPIIPGLADHFSFLTSVPIPFTYSGRQSLDPLYGPSGLAQIIRSAIEAGGPERPSFTLEIHQAEGRLPLGDAARLFGHWRDLRNAERMNYWLSVLAANAVLARDAIGAARDELVNGDPEPGRD